MSTVFFDILRGIQEFKSFIRFIVRVLTTLLEYVLVSIFFFEINCCKKVSASVKINIGEKIFMLMCNCWQKLVAKTKLIQKVSKQE